MTEEKRNGNGRISLSVALTIIGITVPPLIVWGDSRYKNGELDQRVSTLERQRVDDRQETKGDIKEIKQSVRETNDSVQLILRKLDVMEAGAMRGRRDAGENNR